MWMLLMFCAALYVSWRLIQADRTPGYVCPQCGARAQDRHTEGCSWRQ